MFHQRAVGLGAVTRHFDAWEANVTIEVSRRQLLASAGGVVLASFALPDSLRKILGDRPAALTGAQRPGLPVSEIKHVVVLMQENRSFDHYFGTMPGVRGFADPIVPKSVFYQSDPDNPDTYLLPFHTDTYSSSAQALPPPVTAGGRSTSPGTTGRWTGS